MIFIANENGDWWTHEPNRVLYVLDTDDLPEDVAAEWRNEDGSIDWTDEDVIREYGKMVDESILVEHYTP
jgi:hypothetical protein